MNLLERVLTLLRINIDAFLEKAPDPQSSLRQLQLDMRNQLVQVKTQVATAIATAHQLQRRAREKQEEAAVWLKKAEQALRQRNEEAARSALLQYNEFNRLALRYEQQRQAQEQLAHTMRDALHQLEARLRELEMASELLEMKQRQKRIQQRILNEQQRSHPDGRKRQERLQAHLASEQQDQEQHLRPKEEQQRSESGDQSPTTETLSSALLALRQASRSSRVNAGLADVEQQLHALKAREQSQRVPPMQKRDKETPAAPSKGEEEGEEKEKTPSASGKTRPAGRRTAGRATARTTDALDRTALTDLPLLLETLQAHHRHADEPSE
ncbi:PspA/IM30 family protein [Thermogemmatispora sp.]|uniref:PspA/IM30 family protein n=1 Tax=Thermogemmatispora sp. TaxID=1968838 RepID=UPI001DE6B551|nr:PspA/IM30 family protein [Thermogemmatispora sp.]MBX5450628.1 PspA/IM30 family protein [Thermogemmatispora sp.]